MGLITTVIIAGSTMVYMCIQQQNAIDKMQSSLYNIADNTKPENDSGVDNN